MDQNYFKEIVTIFEATKLNEAPQSKLTDNKIDKLKDLTKEDPLVKKIRDVVNDTDKNVPKDTPVEENGAPIEEPVDPAMNDAAYMEQPGMDPFGEPELSPIEDAIETNEQKKILKLFELYRELINYTTVFHDSLDIIDMNLLDKTKSNELRDYRKRIIALSEKLKTYILDTFSNETYEKSLYVYILLRTELLTIIRLLREMLNLNSNKDPKNEQNAEKS